LFLSKYSLDGNCIIFSMFLKQNISDFLVADHYSLRNITYLVCLRISPLLSCYVCLLVTPMWAWCGRNGHYTIFTSPPTDPFHASHQCSGSGRFLSGSGTDYSNRLGADPVTNVRSHSIHAGCSRRIQQRMHVENTIYPERRNWGLICLLSLDLSLGRRHHLQCCQVV
jgi:hypothetical protein